MRVKPVRLSSRLAKLKFLFNKWSERRLKKCLTTWSFNNYDFFLLLKFWRLQIIGLVYSDRSISYWFNERGCQVPRKKLDYVACREGV